MASSHVTIQLDEQHGRAVGSRITSSGQIRGLSMKVEEIVTQCEVPHNKARKSVGSPRLFVVGQYSWALRSSLGKAYTWSCANRTARDPTMPFNLHRSSS